MRGLTTLSSLLNAISLSVRSRSQCIQSEGEKNPVKHFICSMRMRNIQATGSNGRRERWKQFANEKNATTTRKKKQRQKEPITRRTAEKKIHTFARTERINAFQHLAGMPTIGMWWICTLFLWRFVYGNSYFEQQWAAFGFVALPPFAAIDSLKALACWDAVDRIRYISMHADSYEMY